MKCPADTRALFNQNNIEISNFALCYRYFLEWELNQNKFKFGLQTQTPKNAPNLGQSQQVLKHLRNRQKEQLRHLALSGQWLAPRHFYCATSQMDWRMVVGLGGNHVQETNMMLDHVYGIPYLPGSAFKGVVRSWVIQEYFNDENEAMRDIQNGDPAQLQQKKKDFFAVFGSQKAAGKVQFLDALPASGVDFDIDIMNPHFSDYYRGTTFPTDDQTLIQIYFLALKNTPFQFLIVAKAAGPLQLAKDWFMEAIQNRGFGAKSAVGYGYFDEPNDNTEDLKYELAEKLSLDEAYDIYQNHPGLKKSIYIDIEPLVSYAPKFAVIVTEEICETDKIGGISEILEVLIEAEVGMVIPSEFGKWVWEKTKDKLCEKELPAFPNLVYRSAFRQTLKNLQPEQPKLLQRKLLQEKLLEIAIDFRRALNRNLPANDRNELQEQRMEIAEILSQGKAFANLSPDVREFLSGKLWEMADDLESSEALVIDSIDDIGKGTIDTESGPSIVCNGIENGQLSLQKTN